MAFLRTFVLFAVAAGVQFMVDRQAMSFNRLEEARKAQQESLSHPHEKRKGPESRSWLHTGDNKAKDVKKTANKKKGTKKRVDLKTKVKKLTEKVNKNKLNKIKTQKAKKKDKKHLSLLQLFQADKRVTDKKQLVKRGTRYQKKETKKAKRRHDLDKHRNKQVAANKAKANVFVQISSVTDRKKKHKAHKFGAKQHKHKQQKMNGRGAMTTADRIHNDRAKRRHTRHKKKLSHHKKKLSQMHTTPHLLFVQVRTEVARTIERSMVGEDPSFLQVKVQGTALKKKHKYKRPVPAFRKEQNAKRKKLQEKNKKHKIDHVVDMLN